MKQGTDEWKTARLGKVTASRMDDLLAKTKTGFGAGRANYMAQLIAERLTGSVAEGFTNAAMAWGQSKRTRPELLMNFTATPPWLRRDLSSIHPSRTAAHHQMGLSVSLGLSRLNAQTRLRTLTHCCLDQYQESTSSKCSGR